MNNYDEKRHCIKCGYSSSIDKHITGWFVPDFIRRECVRCGHVWREEPIDN